MKMIMCVKNFIFHGHRARAFVLASILTILAVCVDTAGVAGATDRESDLTMTDAPEETPAEESEAEPEPEEKAEAEPESEEGSEAQPEESDPEASENEISESNEDSSEEQSEDGEIEEKDAADLPVVLPEEVTQEAVDEAAEERAQEEKKIADELTDIAVPSFNISVPQESIVLKSAVEGRATRMNYTLGAKNLKIEKEDENGKKYTEEKKVVVSVGDVWLESSGIGGSDGHLVRVYTFPADNPLPESGNRAARNKYYEIMDDISSGGNMVCELVPSETIYTGHWNGRLEFTVRLVDADRSIEDVSGLTTEQLNSGEIEVSQAEE